MRTYHLMKNSKTVGKIIFNSRWKIQDFEVNDKRMMPLGTVVDNAVSLERLNKWFYYRTIPKGRKNCEDLKENLNLRFIEEAMVQNGAFSLFDSYWIKAEGSVREWRSENHYDNPYDNEVTRAFAGTGNFTDKLLTGNSPVLTIPWKENYVWQKNGEDNFLFCFEDKEYILHEYFLSTKAAAAFRLPVPEMFLSPSGTYCAIRAFTAPNIEYVPAAMMLCSGTRYENKKETNMYASKDQFSYLMQRCFDENMKDAASFLQRLICFDYICNNTARTYMDFGFLRNAEDGAFLSPAPVFRNGYGMYHPKEIKRNKEMINYLTFTNTARALLQIKNPTYLSLDFEQISKLPDEYIGFMIKHGNGFKSEYIEQKAAKMKERIQKLPQQFLEIEKDKYAKIIEDMKL